MTMFDSILIIEDDVITSFLIEREVNSKLQPKKIKVFNQATLALDYINELKEKNEKMPDIILLDLNMPFMDGWDFLNIINKIHHIVATQVVVVSSSINPSDLERTKKYQNVLGFISKPFEVEKLMALY